MKLLKSVLLILFFLLTLYGVSQSISNSTNLSKALQAKGQVGQQILGSWKLQEIHYQYTDTTYIVNDEDHGRFMFTDSNYVLMYNPMMQKRKAFENLSKPDQEEITSAFRSIVFNTGTYTLENHMITTIADIAKVPGFEGGQQYYKLTLANDDMELVMYDETYPNGNKPEWFGKLNIKFILKRE